jgi:hypothetical protein
MLQRHQTQTKLGCKSKEGSPRRLPAKTLHAQVHRKDRQPRQAKAASCTHAAWVS